MSEPPPPHINNDSGRNVRINHIICASAPFAIALLISAVLFGPRLGVNWQEGAVGFLILCVPLALGFVVSLKWRKEHPGAYIAISIGMSLASACVLTALAVGACFGIFAIGGGL